MCANVNVRDVNANAYANRVESSEVVRVFFFAVMPCAQSAEIKEHIVPLHIIIVCACVRVWNMCVHVSAN